MSFSRVFSLTLAAVFAIAFAPQPAPAQGKPALSPAATQALATVHRFIDAFNHRDTKSALATCAPRASIIDDIPPHEWQGSNACADWARDLAASDKASGVTGGNVTLSDPWRVEVNGTSAYVVLPASYSYKVHGKPVTESGSIFTVALQRLGGTWRITGWAWSAR
jgi:hypothetical protein